ncbi:pyrroline-5-carboxylate reductase [uncultured Cocleimonas sp.]|uniref:pyrroline-5-carboxylate reductase n=1 Tax=uncultured Cocleimonas sp. TaxID=1051587 RepID=UPI002638D4D3|nr:pyrroline-5-carboxylate reductase [uncultured Cocleimonas sp.]
MGKTITFIGAGNMSRSLIAGLLQDGSTHNIRISDPNEEQLTGITANWAAINSYVNNAEAIDGADVVVLAVKPQIMQMVCEPLAEVFEAQNPLVISIAAGINLENLEKWLGDYSPAVVRCMPNTPSLVQSGMTGLFANKQVSEEQKNLAESIMRAVGSTLWLDDEGLMDTVTAVSGSGPAYFFLVMEAMQDAAQKMGLSAEDARLLVLQTAFGAAKLALESSDDASILRQRVTSKGGTTEAALKKLVDGGLPSIFEEALVAAAIRSKELSKI